MPQSEVEKLYVIAPHETDTTFKYDNTLPSLPLPSLRHTLDRYLDSVQPLVTGEEFQRTQNIVRNFETGVGWELHQKLKTKAHNERNWVEKWWEELAYLSLREPLVPYWSMDGIQPADFFGWTTNGRQDQIKHSALYAHYMVKFWKLLRDELLKPSTSADGKTKFSMSQFRRFYNTVRKPGLDRDKMECYFKTAAEGSCSSEVVVLCRGHVFLIESLDDRQQPITPLEWEKYCKEILEYCDRNPGQRVPILTCDTRANWSRNRALLESNSYRNFGLLQRIEEAMFVLVLDQESPATDSLISQNNLCGDYNSRWADKSCSLIYYANGACGGLCEHCAFDGIVSMNALFYIYLSIHESKGAWQGTTECRKLPEIEEVTFDLSEELTTEIDRLQQVTLDQKKFVKISRKPFLQYGKKKIQQFKYHPDSFIQMAIHLAYYQLHSEPAPCYETATTRGFYNGRTETVRSCTKEVVSWLKSMKDATATNIERRSLLESAINRHNQLMSDSRGGHGCDRHLFGLYCIALEEGLPVPEIYTDVSYTKSGGGGNFTLSTSLTGYSPIGGGVAPMCTDGYGCFYNILPDRIVFTVSVNTSSTVTCAERFQKSLEKAFLNMKKMLEDSTSLSKL